MAKRDVAAEIRAIARERILVLDGAWGTLIHGAGLGPADYRGERFADHPVDVTRRPGHPQPDPAGLRRGRPRAVLRGRRRHHDHEHLHRDLDRPGRLRARAVRLRDERRRRADRARGRRRPVRRRLGRAAQRHAVAQSAGRRPRLPHAHVRPGQGGLYAEQMLALAEGGVDLLLLETVFDTLNAKAAIVAARESVAGRCRSGSRRRSSTAPAACSPARRSRRSGPRSSTPSR